MPERQSIEERALLARAQRVLPGGSLGNMRLADEYAFVVQEGRGSHIWDASGNEYIDYLLGSGPMVLGHSNPIVLAAVEEALRKGSSFFTQNPYAVELAEAIVNAVPCAEQVRFTTSGTDATFQCLRLARAHTRRDKILKFEGGFHGTHDYAMMSVTPDRPAEFPVSMPSTAGIPRAVQGTVLVAPYNDIEATAAIIERHRDELAAVIVEPIQRIIEPRPGFLQGLRDVTAQNGVLLVFDEVVTGFRLAYGGAQERYGVVPDLAALGKIVGGGMPLGAVVGRRELMAAYDATAMDAEGFVSQIGTLNGNPVACAAGIATLAELRKPGVYERYAATGAALRGGLQRMLDDAGVPAYVSGDDVLFDVYFGAQPISDYRSTLSADYRLNTIFSQSLFERGVFKGATKTYVGMCHTDADVAVTLDAFAVAVDAVKAAST